MISFCDGFACKNGTLITREIIVEESNQDSHRNQPCNTDDHQDDRAYEAENVCVSPDHRPHRGKAKNCDADQQNTEKPGHKNQSTKSDPSLAMKEHLNTV